MKQLASLINHERVSMSKRKLDGNLPNQNKRIKWMHRYVTEDMASAETKFIKNNSILQPVKSEAIKTTYNGIFINVTVKEAKQRVQSSKKVHQSKEKEINQVEIRPSVGTYTTNFTLFEGKITQQPNQSSTNTSKGSQKTNQSPTRNALEPKLWPESKQNRPKSFDTLPFKVTSFAWPKTRAEFCTQKEEQESLPVFNNLSQ